MTRAEENTRMAAKLYGCRRIARQLLGSEYAARIVTWRAVLEAHMAKHQKTNVLSSVIALSEKMGYSEEDALALVMLMAAAVEIIEQQPKGQA